MLPQTDVEVVIMLYEVSLLFCVDFMLVHCSLPTMVLCISGSQLGVLHVVSLYSGSDLCPPRSEEMSNDPLPAVL